MTNSSIQKERQYAKHQLPAPCRADGVAGGPEFFEGGTKCSLGRLFHYLKVNHGIDRDALWARITETCLRALFVAQDVIPHAVRRSCSYLAASALALSSGPVAQGCRAQWSPILSRHASYVIALRRCSVLISAWISPAGHRQS